MDLVGGLPRAGQHACGHTNTGKVSYVGQLPHDGRQARGLLCVGYLGPGGCGRFRVRMRVRSGWTQPARAAGGFALMVRPDVAALLFTTVHVTNQAGLLLGKGAALLIT